MKQVQMKPGPKHVLTESIIALWFLCLSAAMPVNAEVASEDNARTTSHVATAQWMHLEDPAVGFSLYYPGDWSVSGQVAATQFALGARCRSVRIIDFEPPPYSGAAAHVEQAYVQVCVKPLEPNDSLDQYMRRVYGELLNQTFVITDLNGTRTYQAKAQGYAKTIFAETRNGLIQIVATVATSPEKVSERQAQVEKILGSLTLI